MANIELARAAREDLLSIRSELEAHGIAASMRYERLFSRAFRTLERFPRAGRERPDLHLARLRSLPVPPYVIVYRYREPTVEVVRVLHGARDLTAIV